MKESTRRVAVLGDAPEQIAAFREYLAAFSAGDFERFPTFYTDDIVFDLGVAPPMHGKAQVIDFYRAVFASIREQVTLERLSARPDALFVSIQVLFTAFKDMPDFVLKPLLCGENIVAQFNVIYRLRAGLICSVKVSMIGEPRAAQALTAG